MAKRERPANRTGRSGTANAGEQATAAQKSAQGVGPQAKRKPPVTEASLAALAAGREAKRKIARQALEEGRTTAGERWAMLLSGTLTVKDLDDKEVEKMRVKGKDGTFAGKRPKIPSHLAEEFQKEHLRRVMAKFRDGAKDAVEMLNKVVADDDEKTSDRLKAADMLLNRVFGRAPETIRVEAADKFHDVIASTVGVDRNIPDDPSEITEGLG